MAGVKPPVSAAAMLDREYLQIRSRLLDVAAMLDRIDRAAGGDAAAGRVDDDPRLGRIRQTLAMLAESAGDGRAERMQRLFSLPYDADWRTRFGL